MERGTQQMGTGRRGCLSGSEAPLWGVCHDAWRAFKSLKSRFLSIWAQRPNVPVLWVRKPGAQKSWGPGYPQGEPSTTLRVVIMPLWGALDLPSAGAGGSQEGPGFEM